MEGKATSCFHPLHVVAVIVLKDIFLSLSGTCGRGNCAEVKMGYLEVTVTNEMFLLRSVTCGHCH